MNYELLLNKEESRIYGLLKALQDRPGMSATFFELQEELALSSFLLDKSLTILQEDISRFKMANHFKLIISDTNVLLETDSHYSRKLLQWNYLSESLSLEMIIAIFRGKYCSTEQFAENHHVSYSVAYKTLQFIKKALKPYQIMVNKGRFVGNKLHIFLFLSELFPSSTIPEERIYSKTTCMKAEKIVNILSYEYGFTRYEASFFNHYVAIMIEKKINFNEILSEDAWLSIKQYEFFYSNQEWGNSCENVRIGIFIWLYQNRKYNLESTSLAKRNEESIISLLNQLFCDSLTKHFGDRHVKISQCLMNDLTIVHFSVCYVPNCLFKELEITVDYFKQNYPEYYQFLVKYVTQLHRIYPIVGKFQSYLFFQYLLLLINYLPIEEIEEPVKIMLDFSWGEQYNAFIKKNLSFFVNLNIEVVENEDFCKVDIILTNINRLYKDNQSKIMVWLDPPQTNDWLNLTNTILEVKQNNR